MLRRLIATLLLFSALAFTASDGVDETAPPMAPPPMEEQALSAD